MREMTFGALPVGEYFRFVPGLLTFCKVKEGYYALSRTGYGGLEYEAASTPVVAVTARLGR